MSAGRGKVARGLVAGNELYITDDAESRAIAGFLTRASNEPCAVVVKGEAGIGKTTRWLAVQHLAREQGFEVLSARPAQAETVLAYAVLADLLTQVDPATWTDLPHPQRLAIDRVMLRATDDDVPADPRAVGAALLAIIEELARHNHLIVAIDDVQWVDPSSAAAIAFAARRVRGPVGVVAAVRTGETENPGAWLQLHSPDAVHRIELQPMCLGALHRLLSERLGRSFPRPTMVRIHEVSGGNPFYAIELARTIDGPAAHADLRLPPTLAELVRARLDGLQRDARDLVLAAACAGEPTIELLETVLGHDPKHLLRPLEQAEAAGILVLDGHRVRFSHPLLASGVYTGAAPALRRRMHQRLADAVTEPELRARHLARAATRGDSETLSALDAGAEVARIRGAPSAAAELLELAMGLGGDTPDRKIRAAIHHFNAGNPARARALLNHIIDQPAPKALRAAALRLLGLWSLLDGSSREGVQLLDEALNHAGDDLALRVQILIPLAHAQVNIRHLDDAATSVADAVRTAERTRRPHLVSQALAMHAIVSFLLGDGLDEPALERALELEDRDEPITAFLDATVQSAVLMGGSGQLDKAHDEWLAIRRHGIERGEEIELLMFAFHSGLTEIWRGNFADAAQIAEDVRERSIQLGGGDLPLVLAPMLQSALAAYTGQEFAARRGATEAVAICQRCDSPFLVTVWPITTLGFLDVSLGNYKAALDTLEPWVRSIEQQPNATEIFIAPFLPDAIEAMTSLGRLDEAEHLINILETNGRRLDRPWMLAVGARGRAMLLAARGDLKGAMVAVEAALVEHKRLPMPFERARTQLLLGQIQRRRRMKSVAAETLRSVLQVFEELGAPLWAERTRAELARVKVGPQNAGSFSAAEQRVAELAASGMTNREVAAAMLISPKTVESNLARVYRKLGIHSRAELGRSMGQHPE